MKYNLIPGTDGLEISYFTWHGEKLVARSGNRTTRVVAWLIAGLGAIGFFGGLAELLTGAPAPAHGKGLPPQGMVIVSPLIFALGLLGATVVRHLELDPARRTYRFRHGFWRWTKFRTGSFDDFACLRLEGSRWPWRPLRTYYTLSLVWKDKQTYILAMWRVDPLLRIGSHAHKQAQSYLNKLVDRLGLVGEDET